MTVKGNQTLFLYKIHTHFKGVSVAGSHIQATLKCEHCDPITVHGSESNDLHIRGNRQIAFWGL